PMSPGSGGSTVTYSAGRAIRKAAEATAQLLLEAAAIELEISLDDLELVDGTVRPRGTPERAIPLARLVRANARAGRAPIEEHGQLQTGTFLDYAMPRARDVGRLSTTAVEVPAPEGPLGAKGIGEAPVIPGPAAIANAVAAATGLRLRDLPMSQLRVWRALND